MGTCQPDAAGGVGRIVGRAWRNHPVASGRSRLRQGDARRLSLAGGLDTMYLDTGRKIRWAHFPNGTSTTSIGTAIIKWTT
jgi:hypothetical protein